MRTTLLVVVLALGLGLAKPGIPGSDPPTLAVNLSQHPGNVKAARLAEAVRKACELPSMNCKVVSPLEATTFLHLSTVHISTGPEAPGTDVIAGIVDIKSTVMIPGSISARDSSIERLAFRLLTSVKQRHAKGAGVIQLRSTDLFVVR